MLFELLCQVKFLVAAVKCSEIQVLRVGGSEQP